MTRGIAPIATAALLAALPLFVGCPGSSPSAPEVATSPAVRELRVEGVVRAARLTAGISGTSLPDRALVELVVRAPAGAARDQTRFSFFSQEAEGLAERPTKVTSREDRLSLPPGRWDVHADYRPAAAAHGEGWIRGLVVETRAIVRLEVDVELRTGELTVRLVNRGRPLSEGASYSVYRAPTKDEGAQGLSAEPPIAEGAGQGRHVLPFGRYRVAGRATWSEALSASASRGGVRLDDEHLRAQAILDFDVALGRLLPTAEANGRNVDDDTAFVIYRAGSAGREGAEPVLRGWGGDPLVLPEGLYDVFARYRPAPFLSATRWLRGVQVPGDGESVPLATTWAIEEGRLRFRVLRDGVEVRDGLRARVVAAGARGDPLGEIDIEGALRLPPGRYDVELRHTPANRAQGARMYRERGVVVEAGRETLREVRLPAATSDGARRAAPPGRGRP